MPNPPFVWELWPRTPTKDRATLHASDGLMAPRGSRQSSAMGWGSPQIARGAADRLSVARPAPAGIRKRNGWSSVWRANRYRMCQAWYQEYDALPPRG